MPKQKQTFSDEYSRQRGNLADCSGERKTGGYASSGAGREICEEIVCCIWFGEHFHSDQTVTCDGRRVEVRSPGWWNVESGPDFRHAELLLEGRGRLSGSVEIHTYSSDWRAHGHDRQSSYADVVLHVVMWNDLGEAFVSNASGEPIPQLELSRFLNADLADLVDTLGAETEPRPAAPAARGCRDIAGKSGVNEQAIAELLDLAGDERVLARMERYRLALERGAYDQVLYEGVLEALGYKNNVAPCRQLSRLLPLEKLRADVPLDALAGEVGLRLEAIFLGAAGFIPPAEDNAVQPDSRTHVEELRAIWNCASGRMGVKSMPGESWALSGARPLNFPQRRLAGMARYLAGGMRAGLFKTVLEIIAGAGTAPGAERKVIRGLERLFTELKDPFWGRHCSFTSRPLARGGKLIGRGRAGIIVGEVILPIALCKARAEEDAGLEDLIHRTHSAYPRQEGNAVTRMMAGMLFDDEKKARRIVNSARRQKGLYQIYRDFCGRDDVSCDRCLLYAAARK
ncbi:MAG TPA: DUF2851 family protein [Candidatus Brocadiia bacterium]|nr:DUF2851 family protein [Candidatus Brocadiia bacterium]